MSSNLTASASHQAKTPLTGRFSFKHTKKHINRSPLAFSAAELDTSFGSGMTPIRVCSVHFGDDVLEKLEIARDLYAAALRAEHGVLVDFELAIALYRESAALGFAGAQNNLGDMYEHGRGTVQSDVLAMYWYARAAERGEPTAFLSLAGLLYKNKLDQSMLIEAMKYALWALALLPDGGNKDISRSLIKLLTVELSVDEICIARTLASDWSPLFQEQYLQSDDPSFSSKWQ